MPLAVNFIPELSVELLTAEKQKRETDLAAINKEITTLQEQLAAKIAVRDRLVAEIAAINEELNRQQNEVIPAPAAPQSLAVTSTLGLITTPVIENIEVTSGDVGSDDNQIFESGQKVRVEVELNSNDLALVVDFAGIDGGGEVVGLYDDEASRYIVEHTVGSLVDELAEKILPIRATAAAAKLEWNLNSENDLKGYKIYRKIAGDNEFELVATISNRLTKEYVDTSLVEGTEYVYNMTAYDIYGNESEKTTNVTVTVVGETVENVTTVLYFPALTPPAPSNITARVDTSLTVKSLAIQDPDNQYDQGETINLLLELEGDFVVIEIAGYPSGSVDVEGGYPLVSESGFTVTGDFSNVDSGPNPIEYASGIGENKFQLSHTITSKISGAGKTVPVTVKETAIVVNWRKHTERDVGGYVVFRSEDGMTFTEIARINDRNVREYRDSVGVLKDRQYYYNVKAFDIYGNTSVMGTPFPIVTSEQTLVDNRIVVDIL